MVLLGHPDLAVVHRCRPRRRCAAPDGSPASLPGGGPTAVEILTQGGHLNRGLRNMNVRMTMTIVARR
eukprot:1851334-Heterocapsa_arctica.AAC.1